MGPLGKIQEAKQRGSDERNQSDGGGGTTSVRNPRGRHSPTPEEKEVSMNLIDAANEIMEELEWTARTAARDEQLSVAQRTAIRLALAFGEGRACADLVALVRGIGVLVMLGEFELRPAKDNPSEFGRLGPHGIVMGIRTGAGRRVVREGGDAHAVGARLWRAEQMLADGSARRLFELKLRTHLERCALACCNDARSLLAQTGGQSDVLVLAWAWDFDAWDTVAGYVTAPRQALELYEAWADEAELFGAQLVQLSHPGIAAVRTLARVSNRVSHLWAT